MLTFVVLTYFVKNKAIFKNSTQKNSIIYQQVADIRQIGGKIRVSKIELILFNITPACNLLEKSQKSKLHLV